MRKRKERSWRIGRGRKRAPRRGTTEGAKVPRGYGQTGRTGGMLREQREVSQSRDGSCPGQSIELSLVVVRGGGAPFSRAYLARETRFRRAQFFPRDRLYEACNDRRLYGVRCAGHRPDGFLKQPPVHRRLRYLYVVVLVVRRRRHRSESLRISQRIRGCDRRHAFVAAMRGRPARETWQRSFFVYASVAGGVNSGVKVAKWVSCFFLSSCSRKSSRVIENSTNRIVVSDCGDRIEIADTQGRIVRELKVRPSCFMLIFSRSESTVDLRSVLICVRRKDSFRCKIA